VVALTRGGGRSAKNTATAVEETTAGGVRANAAPGKAFQEKVAAGMEAEGWIVAQEVTLETVGGATTRMDIVATKGANIRCIECKSSSTAPLTPRQRTAHPRIASDGAN
jgi:hypothetical protein